MEKSQHRHDISDKAWAILEPMLPGQRGQWGGVAEDNRRFINGVFWILRTGAPWRDLPPDYGKWGSVHQRFRRWRDKGMWEKILEALIRYNKLRKFQNRRIENSPQNKGQGQRHLVE